LNGVNRVDIYGNVISSDGSVNIASKLGKVNIVGDISAVKGVAAVGTEFGDMAVTGNVSGKKVVLYTESGSADISFLKEGNSMITVADELIFSGNHWNGGKGIDMSRVKLAEGSPGYTLYLFEAKNSVDTEVCSYNLDYTGANESVHIGAVIVDNLVIRTDKPIRIENFCVSDRADIYAMGTKTSIYGKPHDYDGEAKVIYYLPGQKAKAYIDLHDMFFDGTAEQYRLYTDRVLEDSSQFIRGREKYAGRGIDEVGGMTLDIKSAIVQFGDGLLLKNYYGQKTYPQRYSMEQLMQERLNFKAIDSYNNYFNKGVQIFERYDLFTVPKFTVNLPSILMGKFVFEVDGTNVVNTSKRKQLNQGYDF